LQLTGQVCVAVSVSVVSCLTDRLVRGAHLAVGGIATRLEQLKYLFRPGSRATELGKVATELGKVAGAAEGRRSANGTGPPRGPLEDWSDPEVGLTSESRVQALIQVAARPVRNVLAGQRELLYGERARQLPESNLRGLEGLAPLGMCRAEDDLAALCGLTSQTACALTPHWGPAPLSSRARARRSEGPASVALLLASGCREVCPGRPSPARGPPSPSLRGWRCLGS
jgi:hypothetical protein